MRYSASVVLVPAYQESGIPTHPVGDPPANIHCALPPPPAFVALTVPRLYSSFNMVLIKNNVASGEDVARLSLSPAGRVAKHCTPSPTNAASGVPSATSLPHIDLVAEGPSISSPYPSSQGPSSTPSPEFSDEESPREPSNFSFHLYQGEEWTDEVEARMQNMIDQMLEDARRLLAEPTINFSERFPDDLLEDSANPRTSCSAASSLEDYDGSHSGDQEDGAEEEEGLGMDIVWEESAAFVPARPLTPIPEESLADLFVVEEDPHSPPLSFKHATCFEERQWVTVRITTKSSAEPPIPPTPPDVYLRQRRRRWKPPDPLRRWVAA
ncbi:hypothetical protein L210DRAFT_3517867 [Boletus edulis BED1]|uniref:Uncharacterized protein n=1 Tax=Boletus edulis BED1 TaxID=1328754 RepID=A0AAD4GLY3_BOLED|nr:hypothetical protein L210DRAFT_3517867 [Boletus edulis BED1]